MYFIRQNHRRGKSSVHYLAERGWREQDVPAGRLHGPGVRERGDAAGPAQPRQGAGQRAAGGSVQVASRSTLTLFSVVK